VKNGNKQKAVVYDNKDGTYRVEFTPKEIGMHYFDVLINKTAIATPYPHVIVTEGTL
jgi:hypothetical protein